MAGYIHNYNNKFNIDILENYFNNLKIDDAIYGCDENFINHNLFKSFKTDMNIFVLLREFKTLPSDRRNNKIYKKYYDIFNKYIINKTPNKDIVKSKQTINEISELKNMYNLNNKELSYIKCFYYNYYNKKYFY